jgi:hypothetical protein
MEQCKSEFLQNLPGTGEKQPHQLRYPGEPAQDENGGSYPTTRSRRGQADQRAHRGRRPRLRYDACPPETPRGTAEPYAVWAWEAISADSGNRPHALLLAREVAVDVAGPVGTARTPGIGSRRLRRGHISGAYQSCICENQRED